MVWRSVIAAVLLSALAGCGGGGDDGVVCTTEARTALTLHVRDAASAASLTGVVVAYSAGGGALRTITCDGDCILGNYEESGLYVLTAAKTGYVSQSTSVLVEKDACHVIPKELTLSLTQQ